MKMFVTGGTGVIGTPLVAELLAAGHEVRAVARRDEAARRLRAMGAEPAFVDLFDADGVSAAVVGVDTVIHVATNVPVLKQMARRSAWETHNRLRTEATRHLVAAAEAHGVQRFVKESVTFMYADGASEWLDEDAPLSSSLAVLTPTKDGEDIALAFADRDRSALVLRFGLFYSGSGNRGTDDALRLARWGIAAVAGSARAYLSSIHVHDAAGAVVAALEARTGVYNVVDDEPLTRREYLDAFATALGTPKLRPVPSFALKAVAGSAASALTASQRVSNAKLREATGWRPRFPSAREGWVDVAAHRVGERVDV